MFYKTMMIAFLLYVSISPVLAMESGAVAPSSEASYISNNNAASSPSSQSPKSEPLSARLLYKLPDEIQAYLATFVKLNPAMYIQACEPYIVTEDERKIITHVAELLAAKYVHIGRALGYYALFANRKKQIKEIIAYYVSKIKKHCVVVNDREVEDISFSPDSKTLATTDIKNIKFWNTHSGSLNKIFEKGQDSHSLSSFGSSQNFYIFSYPSNGSPFEDVYSSHVALDGPEMRSSQVKETLSENNQRWDNMIAFRKVFISPATTDDTMALAVDMSFRGFFPWQGKFEDYIRLWKSVKNAEDDLRGVLAYNYDGSVLATKSWRDTIELWDTKTWGKVGSISVPYETSVASFNAANTMITAGEMGSQRDSKTTLSLWNVTTGKHIADLKGHKGTINASVFSSDNTLLASSSQGSSHIFLWDMATKKLIGKISLDNSYFPSDVKFSPDGTKLAVTAKERVFLWDMKKIHEKYQEFIQHPERVAIAYKQMKKIKKIRNVLSKILPFVKSSKEEIEE